MDELQIAFGKRVRRIRKRCKLSQLDMVRRWNWTLSHYQRIERGKLDVRLSTIKKLADCFGVTLGQMMRGL